MKHINKNPFSDDFGNPIKGKEMEWLQWNSKTRRKANPYIDSSGNIMKDKISEFSDYISDSENAYEKDLNKLPLEIQQELNNSSRLLSERMQVEATGRR
ncbi:MAG: hypothetical protein ACWIPJ_01505 [Polaribacter sp.]